MDRTLAGSPEGLSFLSIRNPLAVFDGPNASEAMNGTELVVIQSLRAVALASPNINPSPSVMMMGKDPSKYQLPMAEPVTWRGG